MSPPKKPRHLRKCIEALPDSFLELLVKTDNQVLLDTICDQTPQLRKLLIIREKLQEEVLNLSNFNLAREPDFVRRRLELRNIVDEVDQLRKNLRDKYLKKILDNFDKKAKKYEEESEQLAQQFLAGSVEYDLFIGKYKKLRIEASKLRVLANNMREIG